MNIPENLDSETKKIIDKLANFVARNGPQFEEMTKQKQVDNPKFSFLFGGDFYTYYKFKVASEIAQMNQGRQLDQQQHQQQQPPQQPQQQQQLQQHQQPIPQPPQQQPPMMGAQPGMPPMMGGNQWPANSQLQDQINQAQGQVTQIQNQMNEQVGQSESNLAAQYQALMQQQQAKIEETIMNVLDDQLSSLLSSCELTIKDLDDIVQPIIESCTKDAILNGKNWIMQRTSSDQFCQAVAKYFLKRITAKDAPFQLRLHLIYLINDVLHHCVRRNVEGLRSSLESVVMPIFCTSSLSAEEDKHVKLIKLLELWEKNKYFGPDTLEKMRDPSQALSGYQASLITENAEAVTTITSGIQQQYAALEKQHQEFVSHLNMQLQNAQQQLQALLNQANDNGPPSTESGGPMPGVGAQNNVSFPPPSDNGGYNQNGQNMYPGMPQPSGSQQPQQFEYNHSSLVPPSMVGSDMQGPPPNQGPPPGGHGGPGILPLPDFSKPPPGFPPIGHGPPPPGFPPPMPPPSDLDLTPSVPYYELPAGLIAPLIRLEDFEYKPLDPKDIRLPPPMPPSERLLAAVEAFYQPPSRERPRDGDGWEKLGLYEFFRAKQRARKMKENRSNGSDSPIRSPSASPRREFDRDDRDDSPPRRRYNSEERRVRRSRSRSQSRSRSRSRSRSLSRSPRRRSLKSRSRSRSRSGSPLPYMRSSRSRSRSPENRPRALSRGRSPTPPSFGAPFHPPPDNRLGEDNKGHQLLRKMGWGGQGLGADEQGIVNPVEAAEVRDRLDMHKGIGIDLKDPFEQFRKNKSQGFIQRMKTRDDEKPRKRSKFND